MDIIATGRLFGEGCLWLGLQSLELGYRRDSGREAD